MSDETSRAEGRLGRTELPELLEQLTELNDVIGARLDAGRAPDQVVSHAREMYFLGEAIAHTIAKILMAVCLEQRLGIPKTESELHGYYVNRGDLDLSSARRLRQFLELRSLSSRPLSKIDDAGVLELLRNREEFVNAVRAIGMRTPAQ